MQIGFESNVKEAYANGTGTANLIDNIQILRAAGPTGVKENELLAGVKVYPNPSKGNFRIEVKEAGGKPVKATFYNTLGQEVYRKSNLEANTEIDLSHLANGIYQLRLEVNGTMVTKRIVIEK
jgi:hypothetical protein